MSTKFLNKKTAIFSLLDTPAFGGAEQYMFSHLHFLQKQGYEIVLATNNKKVESEILSRLSKEEKKTFYIIKAPYRLDAIGNWKGLIKFFLSLPKSIIWCYITLQKLTAQYEQVICLWPGFSDRLIFSPLAKFFHCPLFWIEIGPLEPTFKKTFGFPKLLYLFGERFPDTIITTSLFTKQSIIRNSRFVSEDITLVYPGTRLFTQNEIQSFTQKAMKWKEKEKLTKAHLIGIVARLAHENEIDMVIKAFGLFLQKSKYNDVYLLIIGDGPVRKELEGLTETLSISKQVRFLGFVTEEEKYTFLAGCDFFIFPRAWELDGFGMTTIEAMSLGLPVLTTNFGPQIEIVTDDKEGYKYKPHDSEDLAKYIAKMVSMNAKEQKNMIQEALKRAKYFSEENSHKTMFSIISSNNNKK